MSAPEDKVMTITTAYSAAALQGEADRVRNAPEGTRNVTLNRAAFSTGQLVAAGTLDADEAHDALTAAALDVGLSRAEIKATLRSGLRGGARKPRSLQLVTGDVSVEVDALDTSFAARARRLAARLTAERAGTDADVERSDELSRFAQALVRRSELANLPPVLPLIEGVMSRRSAVLLVGSTGIGKTFLSLSMACAIGTGLVWLGRTVHRTRVLYVVGEGAAGLDARISAWEQAWGVKVSDDDVVFAVRPSSLSDMQTWVEMTAEALALGVGLVVLDTMSSLAPEADETKDAATLTRRLSDLASAIDGTALLIHHPGWGDSTRSRGGYQLEANVDEVLLLTGVVDSDLIELKRKKVKEGEGGQRLWLRRKPYAGSLVIESASADEVEAPLRQRVAVVLGEVGDVGMTGPQLKAALELADQQRSNMYAVLRTMKERGDIRTTGDDKQRRYYSTLPDGAL